MEPLLWGQPFCIRKVAFQEGWPLVRGQNYCIYVLIDIVKWPLKRVAFQKGVPLYMIIIMPLSNDSVRDWFLWWLMALTKQSCQCKTWINHSIWNYLYDDIHLLISNLPFFLRLNMLFLCMYWDHTVFIFVFKIIICYTFKSDLRCIVWEVFLISMQ